MDLTDQQWTIIERCSKRSGGLTAMAGRRIP
jgi:hypothetical protein